MSIKKMAITAGVLAGGNFLFDRFIVKTDANSGGFIEIAPGFGLDDVVRGLFLAASLMLAGRFVKD